MPDKMSNKVFGDHLLTCSICYDHFKKPKVLPCLHSFCFTCITRHHEIYKLCNGGKLSCPTCRAIIPLPGNGVSGFMNDGVVKRVKQLLKELPAIDFVNSTENVTSTGSIAATVDMDSEPVGDDEDTSDDETPSRRRVFAKLEDLKDLRSSALKGATALTHKSIQDAPDPPIVMEKRSTIRKRQSDLQDVIARMRNKMLELYHIENYVKAMTEKEINKKIRRLSNPSKREMKKFKTVVEGKHAPTLALLAKEQDKLYQNIVEGKSVHDITEEILESASSQQLVEVFGFLMEQAHQLESMIQSEKPKPKADLLQGIPISRDLVKVVRAEIEASRNASVNTLLPTGRDPRKMGIRLLFKISGYGKEPGKFDFPTHATFMPNGDLLVADKNNCRLQVFGNNGELKKELFDGIVKPRRARVNPGDGNIYVSDENSETVKIFNKEGDLVGRAGDHYFMCAAGLDFDSKGNLIMVDPERNQVSAHGVDSHKVMTSFLFRYLIDKKMPHPYYVCVNEDDQYIVSDTRNNRVKVFSSTGRLLLHIDKLDCPRGVTVDPYGNILVAEGDRHCVTMYNPYGKFLQYLIDRGEFGLCYPLSLDMDQHGRLAVTQCGYTSPHEVLVFQLG